MADAGHTIGGSVRGREAMNADRHALGATYGAETSGRIDEARPTAAKPSRPESGGSTASDGGPAADGRASGYGVADHATSVMKFSRARRTFFRLTSQSLSASR